MVKGAGLGVSPCVVRSAFALLILGACANTGRTGDPGAFPHPREVVLEAPARGDLPVETLGERAGLWGTLERGLELWTHPYKVFDSLEFFLGSPGEAAVSWRRLADRVRNAPHAATVYLKGSAASAVLTFFAPRRRSGLIVFARVKAKETLHLEVRFRPSLAPLLLEEPKHIVRRSDPTGRAVLWRDPRRAFGCAVASTRPFRSIAPEGRVETLAFELSPAEGEADFAVAFGGSAGPERDALAATRRLLQDREALVEAARAHYRRLLERVPQVRAPDAAIDRAIAWAAVSLEQLVIEVPGLGRGMVSGYSSSGTGTRPRYAWFFEEPALTAFALHRLGLGDRARTALDFLLRFQRAGGKTVHEVPSSLPLQPDFLETSRYAYMHSDGPLYYLAAFAADLRATGDLDWIRERWPRIRRILEWCFRAADPADGLLRTEAGDWGSAESSTDVLKDTQLEAMWLRALRDTAELARARGDSHWEGRAREQAARVERALEEVLWDGERGVYLWGLDRRGRPLRSVVSHHALGIWMGSFPPERAQRLLERFAASDMRADWGLRTVSIEDPRFDPASYQWGSVWPVWSTGAVIGEFRYRLPAEGYRLWRALLQARFLETLGPMPEVFHGLRFGRLPEAVPHQQFSEVAVVSGFFDGLLGLEIDAPARRLRLAPWLPPEWPELEVRNIPCGRGRLDLRLVRSPLESGGNSLDLELRLQGEDRFAADVAPALPAGSRVEECTVSGASIRPRIDPFPGFVRAAAGLELRAGIPARVRVRHRDGVSFLPADPPLARGLESRGLRILRSEIGPRRWELLLEGLPGRTYHLEVFTARRIAAVVPQGTIETASPGRMRLTFAAPAGAEKKPSGFVRWRATVRFE